MLFTAKPYIDKVFRKIANKRGFHEKVEIEIKDSQPERPKSFKSLFLKFKSDANRNDELVDQEYAFSVIRNAIEAESLLRQAVEKYVQQIWKNGFSFIGKNPESVEFVKTKFKYISIFSGIPTKSLFESISEELVKYNNVLLGIERDRITGKGYQDLIGKTQFPIAVINLIPVSHTQPTVNTKTRRLTGWKTVDFKDEDDKFYPVEKVIHIFQSKSAGNYLASPMMIPVIDDCRALRKMEENAEALVFQHAIPLHQYIVGNDKYPVEDDDDIEAVKSEVSNESPQGMFVTPHNHQIVAVGNGTETIDVEKYMAYFRKRIIGGLGLSSIVFGEGDSGNKGTAHVQDRGLQDGAKRYASTIKTFIEEFLIREFLLEGGFDPLDQFHQVELFIPEMDIDSKIAKENHIMSLYQGNCITEDEMRAELGKEPIQDEETRKLLYFWLNSVPRALIGSGDENSGIQWDIPKRTANKSRPQNQYGTKKTSEPTKNDKLNREVYFAIDAMFENLSAKMLKEKDIIKIEKYVKDCLNETFTSTSHLFKNLSLKGDNQKTILMRYNNLLQSITKDVTILLNTVKDQSGQVNLDVSKVVSIFDTLRPRASKQLKELVDKTTESKSELSD